MFAVGIERGVTQFMPRRCAFHQDVVLLAVVKDDQFAARVFRRQANHQGRDHPIELLAIPMRQKEAALFVDQQFVKVRVELDIAEAQVRLRAFNDRRDHTVPFRAGELKLLRIEFPYAPYVSIDDRIAALSIRSLSAALNELFRLSPVERQAHRPETLNFQTGHCHGQIATDAKVARSINSR